MKLEDLTDSVYHKLVGCDTDNIRLENISEIDRNNNTTNWIIVEKSHLSVYISKEDYYLLSQMHIDKIDSSIVEYNKDFYNGKDNSIMLHGVNEIGDYISDYSNDKDFSKLVAKIVKYSNKLLEDDKLKRLHIEAQRLFGQQ